MIHLAAIRGSRCQGSRIGSRTTPGSKALRRALRLRSCWERTYHPSRDFHLDRAVLVPETSYPLVRGPKGRPDAFPEVETRVGHPRPQHSVTPTPSAQEIPWS